MTVQLIGFPVSPHVRSVRAALAEKGIAHEFKEISFEQLATPEYAKLHPFRKMPALVVNEVVLYETPAILRYLDEGFDGPALQPSTPLDRAQMGKWIAIAQNYLYPNGVMQLFVQRTMVPLMGGTTDETVVALAATTTRDHLQVLEQQLATPYLVGAALSLADLIVASMLELVALTPEGSAALAEYPRTRQWLTHMQGRDSFKTSFPVLLAGNSPV